MISSKRGRPRKGEAHLVEVEKFVYGLRDPRTNEILYVGQSTTGLSRPEAHRRLAVRNIDNSSKGVWIRELNSLGFSYEIVVLETGSSVRFLSGAEKKWIAIGREALGNRLLNISSGESRTRGSSKMIKRQFNMPLDDQEWIASEACRIGICASEFLRRIVNEAQEKSLKRARR